MRIGRDASLFLAIDIGGSQYALALVTESGDVVRQTSRSVIRFGHADEVVSGLLESGWKLLNGAGRRPVKACGIGFGGPVEFDSQRIVNSTHVPGWDGIRLPELIEKELGLPTVIDNDGNVGGLGEFTFGAGRGSQNLVYYTVSTGIGGGVVIRGEIYRGSDGFAGELGHVPILADGPPCECGNRGCLEALCSGTAIGKRGAEAVGRHPRRGRAIKKMAGKSKAISAKAIFEAARNGDGLANEIVEETCGYLGMGIAMAMNALAPDVIVIGGGVAKAGSVLFHPLRRHIDRFLMPVHRPHLKVVPAKRKGRSVLLGAVALAKSHL